MHDGPRVTPQIEAEPTLATDQGRNEYGMRLFHAAGDTLIFAEEWLRFRRAGNNRPAPGLGSGHRES